MSHLYLQGLNSQFHYYFSLTFELEPEVTQMEHSSYHLHHTGLLLLTEAHDGHCMAHTPKAFQHNP